MKLAQTLENSRVYVNKLQQKCLEDFSKLAVL